MARQCFAPKQARNSRPKAFYSSKTTDNYAAQQHKAAQHRCEKLKTSTVVSADALLRAWFCGPVSMFCIHVAVCKSVVEGHRRQQAFEAERRRLLQACMASSMKYPYQQRAQVSAAYGDKSVINNIATPLF
jgi:hypothetical protein